MKSLYRGMIREIASGMDRVVSTICEMKPTGHLMLIKDDTGAPLQELVYISAGTIIACSSILNVAVRDILLEQGIVTQEQIESAVERAKSQGGPELLPEQVLVQQGRITMPQVLAAVAGAVKGAVLDAMLSRTGAYVFKPSEAIQPSRQLCRIPFAEVALAYGRNVDAPGELLAQLISPASKLTPGPNADAASASLKLLPQELQLLLKVDGPVVLSRLRDGSILPPEDFDRTLFTLFCIAGVRNPDATDTSETIGFGKTPAPPQAAVQDARPVAGGAGAASRAEGAAAGARKRRVLVVDDSPTIQEMVGEALRDSEIPLEIETADDGHEALRRAEANRPELIILDVVMPGMDGFKTCTQLRKLLGGSEVPIIMLTGKDGTFSMLKGKLAGATTYMTKPFEAGELRRLVSEYLTGGGPR